MNTSKKSPHRIISVSYDVDMTDTTRHTGPHCPIHPDTALICPACIAAKGGKSTSPAKLKALKRNQKLATKAATKARKGRLFDYVCRNPNCSNKGKRVSLLTGIRYCHSCNRRMVRL